MSTWMIILPFFKVDKMMDDDVSMEDYTQNTKLWSYESWINTPLKQF